MRKHPEWPLVKEILVTLQSNGFKAYLAGGCVRDFLLNRKPNDLDLATSAKPDEVENLFSNTKGVGKAFGTIIVIKNGQKVEVTSFRKDGVYKDGRHPEKVEYSDEKEDSARRDFTINSMFYDPIADHLVDYHHGQDDLGNRKIKAVGKAALRFDEDKLRVLRGIRFASQLGFKIEPSTLKAIYKYSRQVDLVSKERIVIELEKLCEGTYAKDSLYILLDSQIWNSLFKSHINLKQQRLLADFNFCGFKEFLCFAGAWHEENGQGIFAEKLSEWPISKVIKKNIQLVLSNYKKLYSVDNFFEKALILNSNNAPVIIQLWKLKLLYKGKDLQVVEDLLNSFLSVCDNTGKLPAAIITGEDLIKLGVPPGPDIKPTLAKLYEQQILNGIYSKSILLKSVSVT